MRTEPRAYAVRPQHGARMKIRTHLFLLALGAIAPLLAMAIIAGTLLVQLLAQHWTRHGFPRTPDQRSPAV